MKVLVIGATGMLGSTMLRVMNEQPAWEVFGTLRSESAKRFFSASIGNRLIPGIDVENFDLLVNVLNKVRPDVVVNCAGLTKHKPEAEDPLVAIPINTLLPHRLAGLCNLVGARLIHISTDCVFSGVKGGYKESDFPDARDVYGKTKALGEVVYPHTVTLRTSMIGHELQTKYGLLDWFLSQQDSCKGFSRAIFSGFPTVVLAHIIRDVVIPNANLEGLFHVAAHAISKFDLLKLIAEVYGHQIDIVRDGDFVIDRSLNADHFSQATGYIAPEWHEMINLMHAYK